MPRCGSELTIQLDQERLQDSPYAQRQQVGSHAAGTQPRQAEGQEVIEGVTSEAPLPRATHRSGILYTTMWRCTICESIGDPSGGGALGGDIDDTVSVPLQALECAIWRCMPTAHGRRRRSESEAADCRFHEAYGQPRAVMSLA